MNVRLLVGMHVKNCVLITALGHARQVVDLVVPMLVIMDVLDVLEHVQVVVWENLHRLHVLDAVLKAVVHHYVKTIVIPTVLV